MGWKVAAAALAVSTLVFGVMLVRDRGGFRMAKLPGGRVGTARPDTRGARELGAAQVAVGPKAVAEAAKADQLGPVQAAARETDKELRKA